MNKCFLIVLLFAVFQIFNTVYAASGEVDVLIVGGSASGTASGIQASRMGVRTLGFGWLFDAIHRCTKR